MEIREQRKITDLREWPLNPKTSTPEALARLRRQIERLGFYKPIVITADGEVLGGNQRLKVLREMGVQDVWVVVVEPKSETEKFEIAFSDNDSVGWYDEEMLRMLAGENDFHLEDYAFDKGFLVPVGEAKQEPPDQNTMADKLNTFELNPEKQIVLYFDRVEYDRITEELAGVAAATEAKSAAEAVIKLLDLYENN